MYAKEMVRNDRKYLAIDNMFSIVSEGKRLDSMRISENGRGFWTSISLDKNEVGWLLDALEDFYWRKGGIPSAKHFLGWNKRGMYMVLSELWGREAKRIFILEVEQNRG